MPDATQTPPLSEQKPPWITSPPRITYTVDCGHGRRHSHRRLPVDFRHLRLITPQDVRESVCLNHHCHMRCAARCVAINCSKFQLCSMSLLMWSALRQCYKPVSFLLWFTYKCHFISDHCTASMVPRPQSCSLEFQTAGLQSLRLTSRLKPCLRTIDGLRWLMAASHGLRVQTRKTYAAPAYGSYGLRFCQLG